MTNLGLAQLLRLPRRCLLQHLQNLFRPRNTTLDFIWSSRHILANCIKERSTLGVCRSV